MIESGALRTKVRLTHEGPQAGDPLSKREAQIMGLLAVGRRNKHIASELRLSVKTVTTYVRRAQSKLGANTIAHAAVEFYRRVIRPEHEVL